MPMARHFPKRSRILSDLFQATVVIEAAAKFGSLITARDALDQGRDVLAVLGHPLDARAAGGNLLIRDGAVLVRYVSEITETFAPIVPAQATLPLQEPPTRQRPLKEPSKLHIKILLRLGPYLIADGQLIRDLNSTPTKVTPILLDLELDEQIPCRAGGLLARVI